MTTIETPVDNPPSGYAVRLAGALPKTEQANGLTAIAAALAVDPRKVRIAVVAFDIAKTIDNIDDGSETAVVRILRIEPVDGRQHAAASKLLLDAVKARTGRQLTLDDLTEHPDGDDD